MKLFNLTKNKVVVENLKIAENYFDRTKGLLGRTSIEENEGLLIKNCNWIHMFFMKFPIDVVFLRTQMTQTSFPRKRESKNTDNADVIASETKQSQTIYSNHRIYSVVKILDNIKPWRIGLPVWKANSVLEIKSLTVKNIISVGDKLKILEEV